MGGSGKSDERRADRRLAGGVRRGRRFARTVSMLAVLLAACGSTSGGNGDRAASSTTTTVSSAAGGKSSAPDGDSTPASSAGPSSPQYEYPSTALERAVIVDLAVDWRPEGDLDDDELAAQRQRIQAAEDGIVRALGEHGRVRRQLHASGQVALAVDDEGLSILRHLDEVAAIHEDTPAPPAEGP